MAHLPFKGRVLYDKGLLGVPHATVVLIDKDVGGNGDDYLWVGKTALDGTFEGTMAEWEDKNTISSETLQDFDLDLIEDLLNIVSLMPVEGPDVLLEVPDVPLFLFTVTKDGQSHPGQFFRINDDYSLPIVTPWTPREVRVGGTVQSPVKGPLQDVQVTLWTIRPGQPGGDHLLASVKTDFEGHFSATVDFAASKPTTWLTYLALWLEAKQGSDFWAGPFLPFIENTIWVTWGMNAQWRITDHGPDVGTARRGDFGGRTRTRTEMFNFASVCSSSKYIDSGPRYAFKLHEGRVWYRKTKAGRSFTDADRWRPLVQSTAQATEMVSYLTKRAGERKAAPRFDMIVASGNRLFAKEKYADRFFFTIVHELFPEGPPGIYFKLDPESGQPGACNDELVSQIKGHSGNHPAGIRFAFYRSTIGSGLTGMMIVAKAKQDVWLWHQLDARPPGGSLATIPKQFPSYSHIKYEQSTLGNLCQYDGKSIDFEAVLDIGVGSVHLHESYSEIYGGELQPLKAEIFGVYYYSILYQFFNGQVRDGDGFIDGTCNYYMLCRLRNPPGPQKYALLFIDEQMVFSNRWRAVDPLDSQPWSLESVVLGKPNFMFAAELMSRSWLHGFEYHKYWCPLASGCVNDDTRLAVARQIVAVNGQDRGIHQIYTINYSWGTCDRTWRWRNLPADAQPVIVPEGQPGGGSGDPEDIQPDPDPSRSLVYPQTICIRDDTTLVLKGTKKMPYQILNVVGTFHTHHVGRYYQKYLPADLYMPPLGEGAHQKPKSSYPLAWQFVPEQTFQAMNAYSHFGVYESVNARTQYYELKLHPSDVATYQRTPNAVWKDAENKLRISCFRIPWTTASAKDILEKVSRGRDLFEDLATVSPLSMYNSGTFFRISHKAEMYIATFWDKRDDDLNRIDNDPPMREWITLQDCTSGATIRARFIGHRELFAPPLVKEASLSIGRQRSGGRIVSAQVSLVLPERIYRRGEAEPSVNASTRLFVERCIWRVVVGAIGEPGSPTPVILLDLERKGKFTDSGQNKYVYKFEPNYEQRELLQKYFCPPNCYSSGASIWFEDVVGQKNTAQSTQFGEYEVGPQVAVRPDIPLRPRTRDR